ncbi:MAG: PspC domain-containing protein [Oceanidesulfovibrio sp.]
MNFGKQRHGPYRARDGAILGVFKGLAQHFDFSVFWLRLLGVVFLLGTGFWPAVIIYLLAGLIMKPRPRVYGDYCSDTDHAACENGGRPSRATALRSRFDRLEQRIRRMEDVVTSREFQWDSRFSRRQSR